MRIKFLILLVIAWFPLTMMAQIDSSGTREVLLKEVVIRHGAVQTDQQQFNPDKNVLTGTDQLLNSLSGVSMIKRGNYAWEPGVRGLNNGQIVTTIDGMFIFGACTDRMDPVSSYIEPNNLKSIAISYGINGSASGNTIGGGFDFRIHQPVLSNKKIFSGMLGSGYEANGNGYKALTSLNYSDKRLGINVNGIYRSSGNYYAGRRVAISFSRFSKWNGGIGLKYKLNPHQSLFVNYIRDEGHNIGYPALTMDVLYARANIVSVTHQLHVPSGIISRIENKAYFNTIDHAMDDTKRPAAQVAMHMDMPGTSQTMGMVSTVSGGSGKHSFSAKLNVYRNRLHAEMTMYPDGGAPMYMLTLPDGNRDYYEMGLNDEWQLAEKFLLQTGISGSIARSSVFTEEGRHTISGTLRGTTSRSDLLYSFFAGPVYQVRNGLSVFFNGGYTMRTPTLQELYGFYLFNRMDNYDYLGNPLLKNERSWNVSAGANYKSNKVKLSSKLFSYFMRQYIAGTVNGEYDQMTPGASGIKQYQNLGGAVLFGFETDVEWKLNQSVLFVSNNSFSFGEDSGGDALPLIPPFRTINRLNLKWKKLNFRPEVVVAASQHHVSDAYGETSTPSSVVTNIFVYRAFSLGEKQIGVNLGVENVFDTQYSDHNDIMKVFRPGRNISIQVSWYF